MQQVFANTSKVIVDTKGSGNLLYLPLDKLMQQSSPSSATEPTAERPAQTPTAALPDNRDSRPRGNLSTRERGER
jgi:membrane protease subunit HflK